jgi:hypothetical protein
VISFIRGLSSRSIAVAFGVIFVIALLAALFPPLYLAASGIRAAIFGVPFALAYWIFDAALIGLALWAYYGIEFVRGELDDEVIETVAVGPEEAQKVLA